MIEAYVGINRDTTLANVKAVRIKPKSCKVKDGTLCTYTLYIHEEPVDTFTSTYGCGIDLAIQMLEMYKEYGTRYKMIAMILTEEKMKKEKNDRN